VRLLLLRFGSIWTEFEVWVTRKFVIFFAFFETRLVLLRFLTFFDVALCLLRERRGATLPTEYIE